MHIFDTEIPLRGDKAKFYKYLKIEESHMILDAEWSPKLEKLLLKTPSLDELPYENLSFYSTLFNSLSLPHIVDVFGALLLEKRVLLVSDNDQNLLPTILAIKSFLFPFIGQNVF